MTTTDVKVEYTLRELIDRAGLSRKVLLAVLKSAGIKMHRRGRILAVYLSELRRDAPELWASMEERAHLIAIARENAVPPEV